MWSKLQETFVAHLEEGFTVDAQKLFSFLDGNPSVCRCHDLKIGLL
jgi:hypothetical protein